MASQASPGEVFYPSIDLEPTTECPLKCRSCDRFYLENRYETRTLAEPILQKIKALAGRCGELNIGGWGDPLQYPGVYDLIRHFTVPGGRVHLTTTGLGISSRIALELIDTGVDTIRFRLAGATFDTHDAIRGKGTFEAATSAMRLVAMQRKERNKPAIVADYLLTPSSLPQMSQLMMLCTTLGVDRVEPCHLHHMVARGQEKFITYSIWGKKHGWQTMKARVTGIFSGIPIKMPRMNEEAVPVCPENPVEKLFIAADGTVSPCAYLNPPVDGEYPILYKGKRKWVRRLIMGDLNSHSFDEIWNSDYYRFFRSMFEKRRFAYDQIMDDSVVRAMGSEVHDHQVAEARNLLQNAYPVPRPCRVCIRHMGL